MRLILLAALFLFIHEEGTAQKTKAENLSDSERIYWDTRKQHIRSKGCYYKDDLIGITKEKHGKWRFYDGKGTLTEVQNFYRNRIHGKQQTYHPNKTVSNESYFIFNVADSIYREWNNEGQLTVQGSYEMGSPDGEWRYYFKDGRLKSKTRISNDTVYLISQFLMDSAYTQIIKNGAGAIKSFYISGGLKEKSTYENGLKTGPYEKRLVNGIISVLGRYQKGLKVDRWNFYFPNGRIEKSINYQLDTLHGSYLIMNIDSTINTSGNYKYGKKEGAWLWYNTNDKIEMKGSFQDGEQHGEWQYYFSSGELSYTANYKKGLRNGTWTYYFKDGTLFKQGNYLSDLKEGVWETNYENGTLLIEGSYTEGLEEGLWINYWDNGSIKNEGHFKKGSLNGIWNSYSPKSRLLLTGKYHKGLKTGTWETFNSAGKLLLIESFKVIKSHKQSTEIIVIGRSEEVAVLHGLFKAYSETDFAIKASGSYKNGKKNGTFIDYYPGGIVPTIVAQYKDGKLHGVFQQFSRGGSIRHQINYKNDLKDGAFLIFNSSGKVAVRKQFSKGREIRN